MPSHTALANSALAAAPTVDPIAATSWPVTAWLLLLLALAAAMVFGWLWRRQIGQGHGLRQAMGEIETQTRQRLASVDPEVKGLLSRKRFDALLLRATRRADRQRSTAVLLFINLDKFRAVNESHSYQIGDVVIQEAARRLLDCAGPDAVAARLGADEFLLLYRGELRRASDLAGLLCDALSREYVLPDHATPLSLTCSIGLAAYPQHGSRSRLMAFAGAAMLAVKRAGGGDFMVFEPGMATDRREQADLLVDLRQAIARGELELYYQPKLHARSRQVTAAEALLRWHHPQRGMVNPAVFLQVAERAGLIDAIGQWVITDACRQAAVWRDKGLGMRVAINLSAYQMRRDDIVDRITAALAQHRLPAARFTVEISEAVAMEDTEVTRRNFEKLRAAGLHVAIDDFGVGQASLSQLRRLPLAELKIDASLVHALDHDATARSVVDAVLQMAHALGLKVVAEGVETEAQHDALLALGCDELQGFLFAMPMSAQALGTWALLDADGTRPSGHPAF